MLVKCYYALEFTYPSQQSVWQVVLPILRMKKLRDREVKQLTPGE